MYATGLLGGIHLTKHRQFLVWTSLIVCRGKQAFIGLFVFILQHNFSHPNATV